MNYVKSFDFLGVKTRQKPCLIGSGEPTETTIGVIGELYMDEDTGGVYKCVSSVGGIYIWENINKIILDKAMSDTSENAVQNKVVKAYLDESIHAAILDSWEVEV